MRMLCFALAVACTPVAFAQEAAKTTVQKPVVTQQAVALHRHPTLLSMLRRNNDVRRRVGLFPHRMNPVLTKAAQDHANYMAGSGDFQHYSNGGPQGRAGRYGFRGGVRENIAWNQQGVDGAFAAWTSSGGHYASIVSGTTEAGFGYAVARNGSTYWVGVYGSPAQGDATGEPQGFAESEAVREAEEARKATGSEAAGEDGEKPEAAKPEVTDESKAEKATEKKAAAKADTKA